MKINHIKFPRKLKRMAGGCVAYWTSGIHYKKRLVYACRSGIIVFENEKWLANRLCYHLNIKPISCQPPDLKNDFVLHTCDHKWCVEPDHIYLGTAKQNSMDNLSRNKTWKMNISKGNFGKKRSIETKNKLSKAKIGNTNALGKRWKRT